MNEIKLGDVVEIKSGGPKMTVIEIYEGDETCKCIWYVGDEKHEEIYPIVALMEAVY